MSDPTSSKAPAVRPEAGWEAIDPLRIEGGEGSFVSGSPGGRTLRVRYFRRQADGRLVGRAWFGPGAAGPPGHAHGGAIAAVLDEAMGAAGWLAGYPVVAARIEVDFRTMVPLGTDAYMEAWVESVDGRKVHLASRLEDEAHCLLAEATGLFVILDEERFGELLRQVTDAQSRTAGAASASSNGS
jgi:acyl-coenzyme A thioesterase PaaI-like protein